MCFLQIFLTVERSANVNSETSPITAHSSAADEVNVIVRQEGDSIITWLKIRANHSTVTSHNSSHWSEDSANHSVVIIASRQTHCGHGSLSEISVSEEDILLRSEGESQTGVSHQDDVNRGSEQLPRSFVIIASSSSSSPTSVRSDLHSTTSPHTSISQQNSELVPSKLLSLSLSLLVAAFFQAIRCLTEFIEDTFRTLHCELDMEWV